MTSFRLDPTLRPSGTSFHGVTITLNPRKLSEIFDYVQGGDKTSREWWFIGDEDEEFDVYDWKETSDYAEGLPSPREYWSQDKVTLHVGHKRENYLKAYELKEWLEALCK